MTFAFRSTVIGFAGLAFASASSCATTIATNCFLEQLDKIADCDTTYNNPDPNGTWNWNNSTAYNNCLDASAADKDVCEAGVPNGPRTTLWEQFKDNIETCINLFPDEDQSEALEACIESALDTYMDGIEDLLNPPDDGCTTAFPASRLGQIQSLVSSPLAVDGKFPVSMRTTISIQAGISTVPGKSYNSGQTPCIKHAALLAIYQTKTGVAVELVAADMNTSDGTRFTLPLVPSRFVGANTIVFASLFLDEQGDPRFAEVASALIQPSAIQGDWNRDGVKDTQDLIDYAEFYNLQKSKADLNNDDNIDSADMAAFLEQYGQ